MQELVITGGRNSARRRFIVRDACDPAPSEMRDLAEGRNFDHHDMLRYNCDLLVAQLATSEEECRK